jgi:hypothetical protein
MGIGKKVKKFIQSIGPSLQYGQPLLNPFGGKSKINTDYQIDLSGSKPGYINTTSGFVPAPKAGGGNNKTKEIKDLTGNVSGGSAASMELANLRALRAGLPEPYPGKKKSAGREQENLTGPEQLKAYQTGGGTTAEGIKKSEELLNQLNLFKNEQAKNNSDRSGLLGASQFLGVDAQAIKEAMEKENQGFFDFAKSASTEQFKAAANLIDAATLAIGRKKAIPLSVSKAQDSLNMAISITEADLLAIKEGRKTTNEALLSLQYTFSALDNLESSEKGIGKWNLNHLTDGGFELQTELKLKRDILNKMQDELLLLATQGL